VSTEIDWAARWREGRIGFHQDAINDLLVEHWPTVTPDATCRVLVPLCGKSKDMLWLLGRGPSVLGVELSPIAVDSFFVENGLEYVIEKRGAYQAFVGTGAATGLTLIVGDFFGLSPEVLGGRFDAVYDRAAIVALPPDKWAMYAQVVSQLMAPRSAGFMLTFDYPQNERNGPPFSVGFHDVKGCFEPGWAVELIDTMELTSGNRWELSRLQEPVIHLSRG